MVANGHTGPQISGKGRERQRLNSILRPGLGTPGKFNWGCAAAS